MKQILWFAVVLVLGSLGMGAGSAATGAVAAPAGGGWEIFPPYNSASLYALDMVSESDGWAGGTSGLSVHYDGSAWTSAATAFQYVFTAIDMVDSSYGWATTYQGKLVYYNGTEWLEGPTLATGSLTGISMVNGGEGWAVGYLGGIYRLSGGNWYEHAVVSNLLQGIDMVDANDGWAVGRTGATLHWNGTFWGTVGTPQNVWLMDVDMVTSDDGWAVGTDGVIWHWDGSAWIDWTSPTTSTLRSVSFVDPGDGWAVGHDGTILHYDGAAWQAVPSPVTADLHAIDMLSTDDGWIVGEGGVILHYTGQAGSPDLSTSSKTLNPRQPAPGELVTSEITVRNSGTLVAPGVQLSNATPLNAVYEPGSATTTRGTIESVDPLTVNLGDLGAGEEAIVSFQMTVGDPGISCWFLVDRALISSEQVTTTVQAVARIGTCPTVYLPLVSRSDSAR